MNFKGTTNIPRDQVKGIIEQFGGSWNGYTWIDQTTYMETASTRRARSHAVHRSRADGELPLRSRRNANRSARSSSRSCRAARTIPTAARSGSHRRGLQGAPVSASDDRLAVRPRDHDPRRSLRPLPANLRSRQRDARGRRRRRDRRRPAPGRGALRRHPAGRAPTPHRTCRARAGRRAARQHSKRKARRRI